MLGRQFLILTICLIFGLARIAPVDSKRCKTHDNKTGKCLRPRDCPALKTVVDKVKRGITLTDLENVLKISALPCDKRKKFCCEEKLNSTGLELLEKNNHICGTFNEIKILGGRITKAVPWLALLQYNTTIDLENTTVFKCAGTLITSDFILTAAHCISNELVSVRFGEHNITSAEDCVLYGAKRECLPPPVDIPVGEMIVHQNYSKENYQNDIALIRLKYPVQLNDFILPICLPLYPDVQVESQEMTSLGVVGWGLMENGKLSEVPLKAFLNRLPSTTCKNHNMSISDTQICVSANGDDSCQGDSGGPLAYPGTFNGKQRHVQAGIVSYGSAFCGRYPVAVYTDVSEFVAWITSEIAK
ncbi:hypothetical protein KR074_005373 [Drosophila pseudoananassae]|nr:hypothetical protein KR074_005373 [Drosophila pseudoananassae]